MFLFPARCAVVGRRRRRAAGEPPGGEPQGPHEWPAHAGKRGGGEQEGGVHGSRPAALPLDSRVALRRPGQALLPCLRRCALLQPSFLSTPCARPYSLPAPLAAPAGGGALCGRQRAAVLRPRLLPVHGGAKPQVAGPQHPEEQHGGAAAGVWVCVGGWVGGGGGGGGGVGGGHGLCFDWCFFLSIFSSFTLFEVRFGGGEGEEDAWVPACWGTVCCQAGPGCQVCGGRR
jgi:hypothetical protein